MKMSDNPTKYEVQIEQYLRSVLKSHPEVVVKLLGTYCCRNLSWHRELRSQLGLYALPRENGFSLLKVTLLYQSIDSLMIYFALN